MSAPENKKKRKERSCLRAAGPATDSAFRQQELNKVIGNECCESSPVLRLKWTVSRKQVADLQLYCFESLHPMINQVGGRRLDDPLDCATSIAMRSQ